MIQTTKFAASLSSINQAFLTKVNEENTSQGKIKFDDLEHFNQYNYANVTLNPFPLFIDSKSKQSLAECTAQVIRLTVKMIRGMVEESLEAASAFYDIEPDILKRIVDIDIESQILCRSDIVVNEDVMKVLELNVSSNMGGWESSIYDQVYRSQAFIGDFLAEHPQVSVTDPIIQLIHSLKFAIDSVVSDENQERWIAVFIPAEMMGSPVIEFVNNQFSHAIESLDCKLSVVFLSDETQLSFEDDRVSLSDKAIHCIMVMGPTSPLSLESKNREKILNAFFAGNLVLPDSPLHEVLNDKRNLALLLERCQTHFTTEECQQIQSYIPWSVQSDSEVCVYKGKEHILKDLLLSAKDDFVLKLNFSHGGKDVYIGRSMGDDEWQTVVLDAVKNANYVAQEFCIPGCIHGLLDDKIASFHPVWGIFSFSGSYSGVFVRMLTNEQFSSSGVVNTHNGAQETIVYEA
ncbi:hypothetical protein BB427_16340 [Pseudoalteromonas sp. BMB]|uniref:hypothetical protein n=1 Tax=Pseudoalteromonas sp. BMB TaxID=1874619 RepID=UPI00083D4DA1|nr:hypothetical protein [Pseudoalteromonas sp. BMB]ODB35876.1 hypothetical protein BB427_16340 [Pseudoalteromonas sp. BMB]